MNKAISKVFAVAIFFISNALGMQQAQEKTSQDQQAKISIVVKHWMATDEAHMKTKPEIRKIEIPIPQSFEELKKAIAEHLFGNSVTPDDFTVHNQDKKRDNVVLHDLLQKFHKDKQSQISCKVMGGLEVQPGAPIVYVYDRGYVDFTKDPRSVWYKKLPSRL
jgi:hypothetical protein